jgi:hypothetical protein
MSALLPTRDRVKPGWILQMSYAERVTALVHGETVLAARLFQRRGSAAAVGGVRVRQAQRRMQGRVGRLPTALRS